MVYCVVLNRELWQLPYIVVLFFMLEVSLLQMHYCKREVCLEFLSVRCNVIALF